MPQDSQRMKCLSPLFEPSVGITLRICAMLVSSLVSSLFWMQLYKHDVLRKIWWNRIPSNRRDGTQRSTDNCEMWRGDVRTLTF